MQNIEIIIRRMIVLLDKSHYLTTNSTIFLLTTHFCLTLFIILKTKAQRTAYFHTPIAKLIVWENLALRCFGKIGKQFYNLLSVIFGRFTILLA